jgi:hypothetical protein
MERYTGCPGKAAKKMRDHRDIEAFNTLGCEIQANPRERASTEIDGRARKRIVHRNQRVAVPRDSASFAEGFRERLSQNQRDIFDQVMLDPVPRVRSNLEVALTVKRKLGEQVIEHRQPCRNLPAAAAIEFERDGNRRLGR